MTNPKRPVTLGGRPDVLHLPPLPPLGVIRPSRLNRKAKAKAEHRLVRKHRRMLGCADRVADRRQRVPPVGGERS